MLLPLLGSLFLEGWAWSGSDYVFAAVLFFGTACLFELGSVMSSNIMYRLGFGLALISGFLLVWGNLAVGFIGSEDNPANLMYFGVVAIGFLGAIISRFQAKGLSKVMFVMAVAQALVPVIAWMMKSAFAEHPDAAGAPLVFALNAIFVLLFVGSGLLFRHASRDIEKTSPA
jgi:hypothetical protein